jgi:arylsulfatase A-like enzyme
LLTGALGTVRAKLESKGWWDDTLFVMTSDHGLTPTTKHLDLGDWMTNNGLKSVYYPVIWRRKPEIGGNDIRQLLRQHSPAGS